MNTYTLTEIELTELFRKQRELCANEIVEEPDPTKNDVAEACRELVMDAPSPPLPSGAKKEDIPDQFGKVNYDKLKEHVVDDGGKWLKNAEARRQKRKYKDNAEPELKQGVHDGTPPLPSWIEVKKDPPPENTEVLGWNEKWVDEDFNPEGVCVCFIDGDGKWMVAIWDNNMDNWLAHEEGAKMFGVGEAVAPPTHWMQKPIK